MYNFKLIFLSTVAMLYAAKVIATSSNIIQKDFKMERFSPCRSEMDFIVLFNCIIPNRPISNKVIMSGAVVVKENITGPIVLKTKVTRCNMDMSYCVNYDTFTVPTMCSKFMDKSSPWSNWAASFEPKFNCPLLENTYTTTNASIDLAGLAKLPIEGFHWILKFEFSELPKMTNDEESSNEAPRLLLCLDSDITVRIPRHNRKKNWSISSLVGNGSSRTIRM